MRLLFEWIATVRARLTRVDADQRFTVFLQRDEETNLQDAARVRFVLVGLLVLLELLPLPFVGVSLPRDLYPFLIKLGFLPVGIIQWGLAGSGRYRPWMKYLFLMMDIGWLAFYQIVPNPWEFDPATAGFAVEALSEYRQQALKWLWLFFIWVAFSFSVRYVWIFAACVIAAWIAQPLWLATLPGLTWVWNPQTAIGLAQTSGAVGVVDFSIAVDNILMTLFMTVGFIFVASNNHHLTARFFQSEERRNALSRFFSPNLLGRLETSGVPERMQTHAAILFTDMKGFSTFAENRSPEEVMDLLQEFHAMIEAEIFARDGTLEKYIGDAVMAVFGAPKSRADDTERAFACACACLDVIRKWNVRRAAQGLPTIQIGIGLDYGEVVAGVIGHERNMTYAVVGETVNRASRLEGLTRPLEVDIVMSDRFHAELKADMDTLHVRREVQPVRNMQDQVVWALSRR